MNFAVNDHRKRSLLEISIAFNPDLLREFFFTRQGIWRYIYILLADSMLMLLFCALQIVAPAYFPEIPCYSAVLLVAYLGCRRPLFWALALSFLGGILLDAGNFQPLGGSSLLFCLLTYLAYLLGRQFPQSIYPIRSPLILCLVASTLYVLLNLLFQAGTLPWPNRLALLPRQLLLGVLVNACFAGPPLFAILDFLDRLFGRPAEITREA